MFHVYPVINITKTRKFESKKYQEEQSQDRKQVGFEEILQQARKLQESKQDGKNTTNCTLYDQRAISYMSNPRVFYDKKV